MKKATHPKKPATPAETSKELARLKQELLVVVSKQNSQSKTIIALAEIIATANKNIERLTLALQETNNKSVSRQELEARDAKIAALEAELAKKADAPNILGPRPIPHDAHEIPQPRTVNVGPITEEVPELGLNLGGRERVVTEHTSGKVVGGVKLSQTLGEGAAIPPDTLDGRVIKVGANTSPSAQHELSSVVITPQRKLASPEDALGGPLGS